MRFKKALLWGITFLILSYVLFLSLRSVYDLWKPLVEILGFKNIIFKWIIAFALTFTSITIIGYAIVLAHPFKNIMYGILRIKARKAKGVVFAEYGGDWFLGWLTGITQVDENVLYRVFVPSAPIPISGQVMFVPRHNITFTSITIPEHLAQLVSVGFGDFPEKINSCPCPISNNNRHIRSR